MEDVIQQLEQQLAATDDPQQQIELLNALTATVRHQHPQRALQLNHQVEAIALQHHLHGQGLIDCFYWRGKLHAADHDYVQALRCFYQALALYHQLPQPETVDLPKNTRYNDGPDQFLEGGATPPALYNMLGVTLTWLEQYDDALFHYLEAWRLAQREQNSWIQVLLCNNIAFMYREMDRPIDAVDYLEQGRSLIEQFPATAAQQRLKATMLDNSCWVAAQLGQFHTALEYGHMSVEIYQTLDWPLGQAEILNCLATTYAQKGELDPALEACQAAYTIAASISAYEEMMCSLLYQGRFQWQKGAAEPAMHLLQAALELAPYSQTIQYQCHETLVRIYEAQENWQAALHHCHMFHTLKERVHNARSDQRFKALQILHQVEQARYEAEMYHLRTIMLEQEIQERQRIQVELEREATTDSLTNLFNRRYFFQRAAEEWHKAQRYERCFTIILFDIDLFKHINDTYGHVIGDQALCAMAELTLTTVRQVDIISRYGGEEFAVLLPETDLEGAYVIAERLRTTIADHLFEIEGQLLQITISVGVATSEATDTIFDDVIRRADQALYAAKNSGRNTTQIASSNSSSCSGLLH